MTSHHLGTSPAVHLIALPMTTITTTTGPLRLAIGTRTVVETETGIVIEIGTVTEGIALSPHLTLPRKWSIALVSATWTACVGYPRISGTRILIPWDYPHPCLTGTHTYTHGITTSFHQGPLVLPFHYTTEWGRPLLVHPCLDRPCQGTLCTTERHPSAHSPLPCPRWRGTIGACWIWTGLQWTEGWGWIGTDPLREGWIES